MTGHFHIVYFPKNVAYTIFPFNFWLSFQRLYSLLWGRLLTSGYLTLDAAISFSTQPSGFCFGIRWYLFCSLAVLDPRVGHTMDVLSPFISVLILIDRII